MQKLINVLSLVSFCVSAGVVAGVSYVYIEKDNIIEDVKGKVAKEIEGIVKNSLASGLNSIPGGDSSSLPTPPVGGGSIPSIPF